MLALDDALLVAPDIKSAVHPNKSVSQNRQGADGRSTKAKLGRTRDADRDKPSLGSPVVFADELNADLSPDLPADPHGSSLSRPD